MGLRERLDEKGIGLVGRLRLLVWNSILGLLIFLVANEVFGLGMPYVAWPLLLAVVFGVPGAIAAILLWALVT